MDIPISLIVISKLRQLHFQCTIESFDHTVGLWVVWGCLGFLDVQQLTHLRSADFTMNHQWYTKATNDFMNKFVSHHFCYLVRQGEYLNPWHLLKR